MPIRNTTWKCEKCAKEFRTYTEAEKCETDHIVKDSVDGFKKELEDIFSKNNHKTSS